MDRRVPTETPTYRESMEATYELMKSAARDEATTLERLRDAYERARDAGLVRLGRDHRDYNIRYFETVKNPTQEQMSAATEVGRADCAYQKAHAERKHWEVYWRRYADMIALHPELADEPLRRAGWVRKVAGKAA